MKVWHHFCWVWDNSDGRYKIYLDRKKLADSTGYKDKEVIAANGLFIVGQEQDGYGIINGSRPYRGKMSHLNIWSRYLKIYTIRAMHFGCENIEGNALAWSALSQNRFGEAWISKPSSCTLPGEYFKTA